MEYARGFDEGRSGAGARIQQKHQTLLNQYLALRKDCVAKKKKLEAAKKTKEALLREVRLLRGRRRFLLANQARQMEREQIQPQKSPDPEKEHKDMYFSFQVPSLANSYSASEQAS
ncbi:hypothetical protein Droror1_Dr00016950 [Drosera rotundifolia]